MEIRTPKFRYAEQSALRKIASLLQLCERQFVLTLYADCVSDEKLPTRKGILKLTL